MLPRVKSRGNNSHIVTIGALAFYGGERLTDGEVPMVFIKVRGRKKGKKFHRTQCFRLNRIKQKEYYEEVPITHPRIKSGWLEPCNCQHQRQPPNSPHTRSKQELSKVRSDGRKKQIRRNRKGRKRKPSERTSLKRRTGAEVHEMYREAHLVNEDKDQYSLLKDKVKRQSGKK